MRFSPCRKTRRWPYFQASDFKLVPLWRVIAGPRAMYECKEKEMRISAPTACVYVYMYVYIRTISLKNGGPSAGERGF